MLTHLADIGGCDLPKKVIAQYSAELVHGSARSALFRPPTNGGLLLALRIRLTGWLRW